jgi:hypothetical protein
MKTLKELFGRKKLGENSNSEEQKDLTEMSKKEKKEFLDQDIMERMIRVEQTVSRHFGKKVQHKETSFYKGLSKEDKMTYNRHMNKKKKRGIFKMLVLILPLFTFGLMRFNITGAVVRETTGFEPYWWSLVALGVFVVLGFFMLASYFLRKGIERRLRSHERYLVRKMKKISKKSRKKKKA